MSFQHKQPKTKSTGSPVTGAGFIAISALFFVISGCSSIPFLDRQEKAPPPPKSAEPAPTPAPEMPRLERGTINLVGNCDQREVDGFEESAQVVVENGLIRDLTWKMKIGRRGSCTFEGAKFQQTKAKPSVTLEAIDGSGCKLLMWSDPRRITLAHSNCAKFCTPTKVYDKAWPVMFDPNTGGCADNNKR